MKKTTLLIALTLASKLMPAAPVVKCSGIPAMSFGSDVKIESATLAPATAKTPENCDVRGTIWPEAKFALKLPTAWNSRFQMVGNGGTAGVLSIAAVDTGVSKGYATVSTDTGHDAAKEPLATFARRGPDNPNAERKVIDFGYLAVHETAVLAKKIIKAYYGESPRYSYWVGCSTGGRQGMNEAQRYPEDFDGLVIGAPGLNGTGANMRRIWNAVVQSGPGAIAVEKLPVLAAAVYKKCDAIDGLEDGLIDDPRKCAFDPARDLPKCTADSDGPACFTGAQMEALKKIYGGVTNSSGKVIFPGAASGSGDRGAGQERMGARHCRTQQGIATALGELYAVHVPGSRLRDRRGNTRCIISTPIRQRWRSRPPTSMRLNPDLRPLKKRGGKIIHYHGWADPMLTAFMSVDYYESALRTMGDKETKEFYRLFLIPGMFHCSGGVGCGTVDWLTPMVDWVEEGIGA